MNDTKLKMMNQPIMGKDKNGYQIFQFVLYRIYDSIMNTKQ